MSTMYLLGKARDAATRAGAILSDMVETAADEGARYVRKQAAKGKTVPATVYDAHAAAVQDGFSTAEAVNRWVNIAQVDAGVLVAAAIYLDRFVEHTRVCVTHERKALLIQCALVAADKFLSDACNLNVDYAMVGGIHPADMNTLEVQFLRDMDFDLYITGEEFDMYRALFEEHDLA